MLVIGLDPGGKRQFGWCVAESTRTGVRLKRSGVADHAAGAVEAARDYLRNFDEVAAVGIDSPLFWVARGDRKADQTIRGAMKDLGAPTVGGTVQCLNFVVRVLCKA